MTSEFERDLSGMRARLDDARTALLEVVSTLRDADLDRARRGGWTARRVLEHLVWSEQLYARMITHLRGLSVEGELPEASLSSAAQVLDQLAASRQGLLGALDGVDEEAFYRLGRIGHEEYSVLSVLENEANHEHEHAEQVREILAGG